MSIPNRSSNSKWVAKLQQETTPESPDEFKIVKHTVRFNNPEIAISSKTTTPTNPNLCKPTALTIANDVYDAI